MTIDPAARRAMNDAGKAGERRARVLIVDDHPTNVDILVDLLKPSYELSTATSGEMAIEVARAIRPDLVLLDNMMPGMDGYATCRLMREMPETGRAKILMVSARARPSERIEGYAAGVDDYIAKPFDHDELLAKIRVYLRLKSAEEIASLRSNLITLLQHETRTPMAVLAGALDALRSTLPPAEQTSQAMRMADDAASQLQRLHDRIVLLSRLRSGDTILQPAPTDLSQLARQCTDARQSLATSARVTLRYMGPETTWAWFDAEQASSMIGELIDNALRYTPEGGEVIIETAEHSGVIGVEVLDTGPGIPPEALATIMDEFVVGDIRHHRRGTGLGLAIVRELVTALRGTVTVENREGGGARVALRFPKAAPPAGSVDESPRDVDAQAA